jgi:hypothetical protein
MNTVRLTNHRPEGSTMFATRRARIIALVAAGVLGFGGVAAAGPAAYELLEGSTEESSDETEGEIDDGSIDDGLEGPIDEGEGEGDGTTEGEGEGDGTTEGAGEGEGEGSTDGSGGEGEGDGTDESDGDVDGGDTESDVAEDPYPATKFNESLCLPGNHGKTVSAVARGELVIEGIEVRDAAQSLCGKGYPEDADVPDVEEKPESEPASESGFEVLEAPAPSGKPDHAGKPSHAGKPDHAGKSDHAGKPSNAGKPSHAGGNGRGGNK